MSTETVRWSETDRLSEAEEDDDLSDYSNRQEEVLQVLLLNQVPNLHGVSK